MRVLLCYILHTKRKKSSAKNIKCNFKVSHLISTNHMPVTVDYSAEQTLTFA